MSLEAMKLAIEALTATMSTHGFAEYIEESKDRAITALRQAIEQAQKQEPVAVVDANDDGYWAEILPDRNVKVGQFLYTSPQVAEPQPQRQPLTDEMVLLGAKALAKRYADSCGLDFDDVWKYYADEHKDDAKAVLLAAHGINVEA